MLWTKRGYDYIGPLTILVLKSYIKYVWSHLLRTNSRLLPVKSNSHLYNFQWAHWDVLISGFVIEELDSVQFHHDIIFCLESYSIVVPFSSSTGFLRVDFRQFWFQHITCYFLSSCFHGVLLFLSTSYERELASPRTQFVT